MSLEAESVLDRAVQEHDHESRERVHRVYGADLRTYAAWLEGRTDGESFRSYCDRTTDDELGVLIGREPARSRRGETTPEEEAA